MSSIVACGLFVHYMAPQVDRAAQQFDAFGSVVSLSVLLVIGGFVAWGVARLLHSGLVECPLAIHNPQSGRMVFGNRRYQELYDRANQFLNTRPNRLGV
jgi:hypothetical protein